MGKIFNIIVDYSLRVTTLFVLSIFGGLMYVTKLFLDKKPEYNDGEKAGIYIGISVPALIISYLFVRLLAILPLTNPLPAFY